MTKKTNPKSLIQPLPSFLVERFQDWRGSEFEKNRDLYKNLVKHGQHPTTMVISCCDSRVHSMSLFGGVSGEFFIHRNIANLIPPFNPDGEHHGTSAAIEYAVMTLKVKYIIVLGHAGCGGINGGFHLHKQPDDKPSSSFVAKWLQILKPAFDQLDHGKRDDEQISDLEKTSILVSIENLMGFPLVQDAIENNGLTIHGLWHDIGSGNLHGYNHASKKFEKF